MPRRLSKSIVLVMAVIAAGIVSPVNAQDENEPYGVRGTLQAASDDGVVLETREGEVLGFALGEETGVFVTAPARLEDISQGDYVGLTSIAAGGKRVALEAHLFADELRGLGEGHFPWDLVEEPNTMTNATVAEVEEVGAQRELTMRYDEEGRTTTQVIYLAPDVPIVRFAPAPSRAVLEPGRKVFVMVEAPRGGIPHAVAVVVGEPGTTPPM